MYQEVKKYTQIIKNTSNNAQKEANFQGGYVILFDAKNSMYFSSVVPIVRLNWIKISLYKNPELFYCAPTFFSIQKTKPKTALNSSRRHLLFIILLVFALQVVINWTTATSSS